MMESDRRVGLNIRKLDHMLSRNLSANVKESGIDELTLMHGWIIRYLYENREREIFQRDLEKNFAVGRSTVTNIIKLMEKKGLLCRESVEKDARLKRVMLTEKGIVTQERIEQIIDDMNKKTLEGITEEELEVFDRVVEKLRQNVERQQRNRADEKEEVYD